MGIGMDCVEIKRISSTTVEKLIQRIAHEKDKKHAPDAKAKNYCQYWAARFAVKEAFSKALGTGVGKSIAFKDVGISKDKNQKPYLVFSGKLNLMLKKMGIKNSHISITHTKTIAIAIVILEN